MRPSWLRRAVRTGTTSAIERKNPLGDFVAMNRARASPTGVGDLPRRAARALCGNLIYSQARTEGLQGLVTSTPSTATRARFVACGSLTGTTSGIVAGGIAGK